jgi:hypothetical protein
MREGFDLNCSFTFIIESGERVWRGGGGYVFFNQFGKSVNHQRRESACDAKREERTNTNVVVP